MATDSEAPAASAVHKLVITDLTAQSPLETIQAARTLLLEYGQFVASEPSVTSFCYGSLQDEAAKLPQSYLSQDGGAVLAEPAGFPLGFVAWRSLPAVPDAWEIKRLWVRAEARGTGLGRLLMQTLIDRAKSAGRTQLLLDTAPEVMASAYRLYLEMGFTECPPYNGPAKPAIVYMHKVL
jgi:GNAT superfamily N-acetyltransferase